ncbi:sensor histidine kinase [Halalkalicoccus salilacus]|uniref:sensor histidine kinase n=1 Tax=Halalkalicoccus salilacus TaxID=3117459 RepID=UPI00300EDF76
MITVLHAGRSAVCRERLLSASGDPLISVCSVPTVEAAVAKAGQWRPDCWVCEHALLPACPEDLRRLVATVSGAPLLVHGAGSLPTALADRPNVARVTAETVVDTVLEVTNDLDDGRASPSPSVLLPLLDRSTDRVARLDRDGTYRSVSDALATLVGAPASRIVGTRLADYAPDAAADRLHEHGIRAIDTGVIQRYENDRHRYLFVPDGEGFRLIVQESVDGANRSPEPVTEFIDTVLNRLTDIFFVFDLQGRFLHWNDRLTETTGYTDEEIASMHPTEFVESDDVERVVDAMERVVTEERTIGVEATLITEGGERIPYEFVGSVMNDVEAPASEADAPTEAYICGTGRDITQRVRVEAELEEAIAELERSNDELERFAYVASHDLKEPLRMIRSYLDLVQRRYGGALDEDADEFIEYATDGAERMRQMIDDLLTYSRIGTTDAEFDPVDCHVVLDRVLDNLQIAIEETNTEVTVDALPTVTADDQQLVQLFQNLISNAISYASEEDPRIHVSATETDDGWRFSVADNGIGIEESQFEEVFEIFSSGSNGTESTGIGLAICEKIVARHDGEIWIESQPGEGSTFFFTLPDRD